MSIYITQRNNARFFSQFHDQLKPLCDKDITPIIAYAPKKGFRIEKKFDHYSLTRLFSCCCGLSHRFEDTIPPLEEMLRSTLCHRLANPEDKVQKDALCQELIAAVHVCEKLYAITQPILAKGKEKKNEGLGFHTRRFDLLQKVAELKREPLLSIACQNGWFDMAFKIAEQGADMAAAHGFYDDLLKIACKKRSDALAIQLIELGASPALAEGMLAWLLHSAISQKNESAAIKIIQGERCAPLEGLNAEGETVLLSALRLRLPAVVAILFEKNADTSKISEKDKIEFYQYFTQNPSLLVDQRTFNPLEIPFHLQNGQLLKALVQKLTRSRFKELVTAFSQKYPKISTDLVTSIYSLTRSGLTKGIKKVKIPPKPTSYTVRSLMTLYTQVNFQNPLQPDYYNPAKFSKETVTFDESGKAIPAKDLRSHLEIFVTRVEKKEFFRGAPKEGSQALIDMHVTLENAVANICKKLHDTEVEVEAKRQNAATNEETEEAMHEIAAFKKLRALTVIKFLKIAGLCAGNYISTSLKEFNRVVRNEVLTFENLVQESGGQYREILVKSLVTYRKYGIDVHDEIKLIQAIGKELGIPDAEEIAAFEDPLGTHLSESQCARAKEKFFELYTPTTFINEWLEPQIRTEKRMRNQFIDWCKNNMPIDWAKERFDPIRHQIKVMQDMEGVTDKDIEAFLLKHEIYVGYVDERRMTLEEAIENERVGQFLGLEVFSDIEEESGRIRKAAIAYMLEAMGLIAAKFAKEPAVSSKPSSKAMPFLPASEELPAVIQFVQGLGSRV